MGIKVGTRFVHQPLAPVEQRCPACAQAALHTLVRESQILVIAGLPLIVYRDKVVFDCNRCRHRTEHNVPRTFPSRPFYERFGLLLLLGTALVVSGVLAAYEAVDHSLSQRAHTRQDRAWAEQYEAKERARIAAVDAGIDQLWTRCTGTSAPTAAEARLSNSLAQTRMLELAPDSAGTEAVRVYCVRLEDARTDETRLHALQFGVLRDRPAALSWPSSLIIVPDGAGVHAYFDRKEERERPGLFNDHGVSFAKDFATKRAFVEWLVEGVTSPVARAEAARYRTWKETQKR